MYTANTMASAIEALGLSLPNYLLKKLYQAKKEDRERAGAAVMRMIEIDLKPSDIVSKKSSENAITYHRTGGQPMLSVCWPWRNAAVSIYPR